MKTQRNSGNSRSLPLIKARPSALAALAVLSLTSFGIGLYALKPASASPPSQLAKVHCSPPVGIGQFDPIVAPGTETSAHMHQFVANKSIMNADMRDGATYSRMVAGATTCSNQPGDKAGYWIPTLLTGTGTRIPLDKYIAYYYRGARTGGDPRFAGPGTKPYPPDLRMVSGNVKNTTAAGISIDKLWWHCGAFSTRNGRYTSPAAARCDLANSSLGEQHVALRLHITFPDCWDGKKNNHTLQGSNTSDFSGDGSVVNHLVYSHPTYATCPAAYPIKLPTLDEDFKWDYKGNGQNLKLSSGSIYTIHADFWNTWNQTALTNFVNTCINPSRKGKTLPEQCW